jgi:hypothetical protein
MAEEKEKNNFVKIVAFFAIASITLVMVLKSRETEHLQLGAAASIEQSADYLKGAKRFNNDSLK